MLKHPLAQGCGPLLVLLWPRTKCMSGPDIPKQMWAFSGKPLVDRWPTRSHGPDVGQISAKAILLCVLTSLTLR